MSADALGWVWKHSPHKGATFAVHLALADSANDVHGYEIWARQGWIADKARIARGTVNDALGILVGEGFLELVEDNSARRKPNRYRMVMAGHPQSWDPRSNMSPETTCPSDMSPEATSHVTRDDMHMSPEMTQNPSNNPTESPTSSLAALAEPGEQPEILRHLDALGHTTAGTQIPERFSISPRMLEWAAEEVPELDIAFETRQFADYFRSASGQNASKRDWFKAWCVWMRKGNAERARRAPKPKQSVESAHADRVERFRQMTGEADAE